MTSRIPVSLITGCLGSGKTTLLNRLLADRAMANTAVIINEVGEIGLDHLLVTAPAETTVLLEDGCICCTVRGDFVATLTNLYRRRSRGEVPRFERVIIETTGLADPVPVIQTLATDEQAARWYRLDAVVTLVDCVHAEHQLATQNEAVKQVAVADRLVLTKTDIADPDAVSRVGDELGRINPGAPLVTATRGEISADAVFGAALHDERADAQQIRAWLRYEAYAGPALAGNRAAARHADVQAYSLTYDNIITGAGFATWLTMLASLKGPQLLRCKGLLNVEGHPVVVHAVQTVIHEPVTLEQWPDEERRSRFVFITRGLPREAIEQTFSAFTLTVPAASGAVPTIDPAAYAQFAAAARRFR